MDRDAKSLIASLEGQTVPTLTGRPNTILKIRDDEVLVGTLPSPSGEWVPIAIVQDGLDELATAGEVMITAEKFGHRSAFVGAVLATVPGVVAMTKPARVLIAPELGPLLKEALRAVPATRPDKFSGDDQFAVLFTKHLRAAVERIIPRGRAYRVKGSVGLGNWSETPWVGVFDPMVTESAQRGFYVVYLFRKDGSGVYLSLNQGTTAVQAEAKNRYLEVLADRAKA
jgi:hypothetical protein